MQTIHEILSLVARGRIVHPTSSTVPIFGRDDIILIPIDDLPPIPLGLVWCTSRENPRIRALGEVARSMINPPSGTQASHAGNSASGQLPVTARGAGRDTGTSTHSSVDPTAGHVPLWPG